MSDEQVKEKEAPKCPTQCGGMLVEVMRPVETQGAPILERNIRVSPYAGKAYRSMRCTKCGLNMEMPISAEEILSLEDDDDMSGLR